MIVQSRHALRAAAALAVLALSACGSTPRAIDAATAATLHERVQQVRTAAANGENSTARVALSAFGEQVRRLTAAGALDPADGEVLLAHAAALEGAIPHRAPAATPVVPERSSPVSVVPQRTQAPAADRSGVAANEAAEPAKAPTVQAEDRAERAPGRTPPRPAPKQSNPEPPAAELPAEEPPVETPPAAEPPAEQPPAAEPPAQEQPEQEPPTEEPPASEPPADPGSGTDGEAGGP
ncbi:MAG: hypothetical protein ACT4QF_06655 [Sporichthyaceae bacterium]